MTGGLSVLHLKRAGAEEHDSPILGLRADSQVEEGLCGVWIRDSNLFSGVLYDGSVSEFGHVNVAVVAYEQFEGAIIE